MVIVESMDGLIGRKLLRLRGEIALTCASCGTEMSGAREDHPYTMRGMGRITLTNVEIFRCKACGEWEAVIPRIEELHRVLTTTAAKGDLAPPIELFFDATWKAA